jgi:hypothetical protein
MGRFIRNGAGRFVHLTARHKPVHLVNGTAIDIVVINASRWLCRKADFKSGLGINSCQLRGGRLNAGKTEN